MNQISFARPGMRSVFPFSGGIHKLWMTSPLRSVTRIGRPTGIWISFAVTTFSDAFFKSLGIASEPTRVSAHFSGGATQQMNAGRINDLMIGEFKVPPGKFGVAALPHFALRQGNTRISGILGIDTLYKCNAIIDLEGMNLFLK